MEEQLGTKLVQFTLRLEGCWFIGPWREKAKPLRPQGLWPNPTHGSPPPCLPRGQIPRVATFPWALCKSDALELG